MALNYDETPWLIYRPYLIKLYIYHAISRVAIYRCVGNRRKLQVRVSGVPRVSRCRHAAGAVLVLVDVVDFVEQ